MVGTQGRSGWRLDIISSAPPTPRCNLLLHVFFFSPSLFLSSVLSCSSISASCSFFLFLFFFPVFPAPRRTSPIFLLLSFEVSPLNALVALIVCTLDVYVQSTLDQPISTSTTVPRPFLYTTREQQPDSRPPIAGGGQNQLHTGAHPSSRILVYSMPSPGGCFSLCSCLSLPLQL
ncbi:hypothetical protein B0T26DRAFT_163917 [Lasiosphaeria miniovina]|uniref:Transmembrane protein n=1 Tax=Lasiosphaeria miniovina TaxID=1954250 RepID=A0AA40B5Y3_9PEZI|nr:uncharacterized protein B0T26DRAFT_163917 [Lasiosphaeria miniovina]KAK0728218.1 hypothetical protein B0T26DRAFT_163917 [Lasiosphaeria miniovina]